VSTVIPQRELRNQNAAIIAAVAAGERFVVTRNGTPVAELRPVTTARRVLLPKGEVAAVAANARSMSWPLTMQHRKVARLPKSLAEHDGNVDGLDDGWVVTRGLVEADSSDVVARLVNATATCMLRSGLDQTSATAVATEAGVSRATVYRYFEGTESLIVAVLLRELQSFLELSRSDLANADEPFAEALETALTFGLIEMPKNPWLKMLLDAGVSRSNAAMLSPQLGGPMRAYMRPFLIAAQANGEMRPDLDPDEVTDWIIRQMLLLAVDGPWEEAALRDKLRSYLLPVVIPNQAATGGPGSRRITARLHRVDEVLSQARREVAKALGAISAD
jgi:AcrR family transcriptional regulator/antitoxin (DNA-binding transcriptional repressor) of toxin-antitoxin stability system